MVLWSTYPRYYPAPYAAPVEAVSSVATAGDLSAQIVAALEAAGVTASAVDLSASIVATVEAVGCVANAEDLAAQIVATVEAAGATATAVDIDVVPLYPDTPPGYTGSRSADKLTVTLTWGDPTQQVEFEIWRASDFEPVDGYSLIDTVAGNVFTYEDTVLAGPDYSYRVAAVSYTGDRSTRTKVVFTLGEESATLDDRTL